MAESNPDSGVPIPPITFRFRWVCESGHTVKQTGPYEKDYDAADEGGKVHDDDEHGGAATHTVETSATP